MRRWGLLTSRSVLWAAGGTSALLHVLLVVLLGAWLAKPYLLNAAAGESQWSLAAVWQALTAPASASAAAWETATEVAMVMESEVLPERWQTPKGDDDASVRQMAPRIASGLDPRRAKPDVGRGVGVLQQDAWRADQQTLRAQLTDGSQANHVARTRLGTFSASPQAERRERKAGIGDAPRTAREALSLTSETLPVEALSDEAIRTGRREALRQRQGTFAQTGEGPLEAKSGQRRFDSEVVGAAAEVVDQRSSSNERQPGPIDLTGAGSVGPAADKSGKGPGATSGAVSQPSRGASLTLYGAATALPFGRKVAADARQAQRSRYERAIRQRAQSMLKFPKRLALELQQGETILRFAVGADGSVSGPVDVTKSAGFREFDEAATAAVARAAPFPRMPEPLVVNMRFVFENPVLR